MDLPALILFGLLLALCAAVSTPLAEEYQLAVRGRLMFMTSTPTIAVPTDTWPSSWLLAATTYQVPYTPARVSTL
jgi:hypothetical protein